MRFKTWFETMTSTGCVAIFARPMMGVVSRKFPQTLLDEEKPKKKKKKKDKKD